MITVKWSGGPTDFKGMIADLGNFPESRRRLAESYAQDELANRFVTGGLHGDAGEFRFRPGRYPIDLDGIVWVEAPENAGGIA